MDFLGVELERGPRADRGPVQRLAVGRRPQAGLLAGQRQVFVAQDLEEGGVRRVGHIPDRVTDALPIGVRGNLDHRRHDGALDRHLEHAFDLGDRALGDDPRSRQPRRHAVAQDPGVRGHVVAVGMDPGEEGIEPGRGVGGLERGELRQCLLRTAHLVHDAQLVDVLVVLLDPELGHHAKHVAGDPLLGRQVSGRDCVNLGQRLLHEPARRRAALRAGIVQAVGVAFVAVHGRGDRIELEDRFPEAIRQRVDAGIGSIGIRHVAGSCEGQRGVGSRNHRVAGSALPCAALSPRTTAAGRRSVRRADRGRAAAPGHRDRAPLARGTAAGDRS